MASCAQCGRRTQDGFVLVSHDPHDDVHSHSDAHRKTILVDLATGMGDYRDLSQNICGKCASDIVERVDVLIAETEAYNLGCIKYITDPFLLASALLETHRICVEESIQTLELKHAELRLEYNNLQSEASQLRQEEEKYWLDFLYTTNQLHINPESNHSNQLQIDALMEELTSLNHINIYSDTFIIGITQHGIGTINNLRLGTKPEEVVEWEEMNAAWGQSVLLLYMLAKKLNLTFSKFRLIPMGARPFIQQKDQQGLMFPLHGSLAVLFSRSPYFYEFWGTSSSSSNFDLGMEAFLFCLSELCARVISINTTISLPYYIDKDKIGTKHALKSIKTSGNNEIDWSKALKYMLTNLKRILGYLPSIVKL